MTMTSSTETVLVKVAQVTLTGTNTTACTISGLTWLIDAGADVDRLWRMHASPSARRRRRLAARDAAIGELAALYDLPSGRQLADAVHRDLRRHRTDTAPPVDSKRALLRRILVLGAGKLPGPAHIRAVLAGLKSAE